MLLNPGITWQGQQERRQEPQRLQQEPGQEQLRQRQEQQEQLRQRQEPGQEQVLQQQEPGQEQVPVLLFCRKRTKTGPTGRRAIRSFSFFLPFNKFTVITVR